MKKKILITIMIFLVFLPILSLGKDLEVSYPDIPGKETKMEDIFYYTRYVFDFSVWIIGIVAFFVLILAGFKYVTAAGNPSVIKDAKNQILSAFVGITILLISVFILNTINPDLTKMEAGELESKGSETVDFSIKNETPDPLARIKELSEELKNEIMPVLMLKQGELLKLIKTCNCIYSSSKCDCIGWACTVVSGGGDLSCYGDPCHKRDEIIEKQIDIVLFSAGLLSYHKNRIDSERENIRAELDHFIYWEVLTEKQADNLEKYLEEMIPLLEELAEISLENSELPDECLAPEKCQGNCGGGCHDGCEKTKACYPKACSGGNPCPVKRIQNNILKMKTIKGEITSLCNKIIAILS